MQLHPIQIHWVLWTFPHPKISPFSNKIQPWELGAKPSSNSLRVLQSFLFLPFLMLKMLAASSVMNSNLACSSRIYSCSDYASSHSWRPIEPVKLHRERAARSLRISCAATKPAKTPAEEDWRIKRQLLAEKQVRSVDVKEALRLQKENSFVILDVRPEAEFKEAHPPGAINVQIYRLIKEWTAWDIARRAAFAFFGIFAGTEENPEFLQSVDAKVGKDAKIIVACSTGGTLRPTQNFPDGKQSRLITWRVRLLSR
ncbi:rhodanese-like domain-containing protein 14, chloroplastic isoform X2 [Phragmites australis]|uniref:rhodanese-like domain-containing protein 14, chloroplastic isoform X2 n=1 Tax=Phragmites australis TaxID=29695 RepID=UPI002D778FB0|nr:rhodanese-like domain-containing protein 14, chloroplastic isoform X2 [Phragmites australis]